MQRKVGLPMICIRNQRQGHLDIHVRSSTLAVHPLLMSILDDDYAASRLLSTLLSSDPSLSSKHPHFSDLATQLLTRSLSHRELYNPSTGFLEARNADGSFAGPDRGWTEGDKWAYTFDVVHDVDWLIEVKGGKREFVKFLDEFFDEGHSDHSNEVDFPSSMNRAI